jgi:hypothetical protein
MYLNDNHGLNPQQNMEIYNAQYHHFIRYGTAAFRTRIRKAAPDFPECTDQKIVGTNRRAPVNGVD